MRPIAQALFVRSLRLLAPPAPHDPRGFLRLLVLACGAVMLFSGCVAEDVVCYRPEVCYRPACRDNASRLGVSWATICGRPFVITGIFPCSNAYAAGLRVGDQILASNGIDMREPAAIAQFFRIPPGSRVVVTYFRCGAERHAVVTTIPLAPWQR